MLAKRKGPPCGGPRFCREAGSALGGEAQGLRENRGPRAPPPTLALELHERECTTQSPSGKAASRAYNRRSPEPPAGVCMQPLRSIALCTAALAAALALGASFACSADEPPPKDPPAE